MKVRASNDQLLIGALHAQIMPGDDLPRWTPNSAGWVVWDGDHPCGFAVARVLQDKDTVFLERAGVMPGYEGEGLQRRLINVRCQWARKLGVQWAITYTTYTNHASIANLLRCGFRFYRPAYRWAGKGMHYFRREL